MAVPIIFLSHASRDGDLARSLQEVLAKHTRGEIEWWLSSDGQSIRGGKNWRSEVEQALRDCAIVFILFTPLARQSAWVQYEAGYADALGKEVIPVALPGFDIDAVPGPLQHKQGFNLRGASGLNNIISISNRILGRHDLLSLGEQHYADAFPQLGRSGALSELLDTYVEEVRLAAKAQTPLVARIAMELPDAHLVDEPANKSASAKVILAGPGFVVREGIDSKNAAPESQPPTTIISVAGEFTASALIEMLGHLSRPELSDAFDRGGALTWTLRKGIHVLTKQAQILAAMRGTSIRWADAQTCDFGDVRFHPESYDVNAPALGYVMIRSLTASNSPQAYRPKDIRYKFTLRWGGKFPAKDIEALITLLVQRNVLAVGV
jgi:hypothetical protein